MYVDELMTQKRHLDEIISDIAMSYRCGFTGYRIERNMEHDVEGVCGLNDYSCEEKMMDAEKAMRILFFLLCEKKRMVEAVSKCQKENNRKIVKIYKQGDPGGTMNAAKERVSKVSNLYQYLSERKEIQKAEGGYDIIVTLTSKIDRTLLDALYRKRSQVYESLQIEKEECRKTEIDYEPAIDYTQYDQLGLTAFLCELEEKGVITDGK